MSWGEELWDQYDNLASHTHKGIEFLDKYGQFIKERCAIEIDYASKLRRLVKNHQYKKKDDEDNQYTVCKAFFLMMQEVTDLAGQHELVAENMSAQIVKEISILLKELKDERKRYLHEGAKNQTTLQAAVAQLDKAKKGYDRAYKEAEKAQDNYQRADADLNLSRAEVEKARMISVAKNQMCEDCKTEYANYLQKTNELQSQHFTELMPKIFQQLQDMEERRAACIQNYMKQSAILQQQVFPIINKCLEGIIKASEVIDPKEDSSLVVERYKSGNLPPEDIPFEDLSNPRPITEETLGVHRGSNSLNYSNSIKSETLRGTLSASRFKKRGGIFGIFSSNKFNLDDSKDDYSDLPPNQRRKRLQSKIDQLQSQFQQETAVRDGLMKMKQAYEQNPALGDPLSIEGQLAENSQKMDKLQIELRKFQNILSEVDGKPVTPSSQKKSHRNSVSEDSLSRSASESSVSNNNNNNNNNRLSNTSHKVNNHHNHNNHNETVQDMNDPESGNSTSRLSYHDPEFDDIEDKEDFEEPMPALGTAKAIYAFEAQSEGSIPMSEGEDFEVVELDQGDGWTRVRRTNHEEEGFVPTSYIECSMYNNC